MAAITRAHFPTDEAPLNLRHLIVRSVAGWRTRLPASSEAQ